MWARVGLPGPASFPCRLIPHLSPPLLPSRGGGRGARRARMSRARLPVDLTMVSALTALRVRPARRAKGSVGLPSGVRWWVSRVPASAPPALGVPSNLSPESVSRRAPLSRGRAAPRHTNIRLRSQIRRDNPLNLSILLSGGKETNQDSLSSGERRGKSSVPNPGPTGGPGNFGVWKTARPVSLGGLSPSDRGSARGRCESGNGPRRAGVRSSRSRVVWECSPKRVVNSI